MNNYKQVTAKKEATKKEALEEIKNNDILKLKKVKTIHNTTFFFYQDAFKSDYVAVLKDGFLTCYGKVK